MAEDSFIACESKGSVKYFKPACAATNFKLAALAKAKTDDDAQGATPLHLSDLSAGADKEFLGSVEKLLQDQRDVILQRAEVILKCHSQCADVFLKCHDVTLCNVILNALMSFSNVILQRAFVILKCHSQM